MSHTPVLLQECLELLHPRPGQFHIDGTYGAGGHSRELVRRITPGGTLLAVDRDRRVFDTFPVEAPDTVRVISEAASYATLPALLQKHKLPKADGLLLDLGFSSEQLAGGALAGRGFSFMSNEPLLMTYDDETPSVAQLLAELTEGDLAAILREYGEERYAAHIAKRITQHARESGIATTGHLVEAVKAAVPHSYAQGHLNPATRTFQALRIYANRELHHLETLLQNLPEIVRPGGRVVIISFHSLEDRIVKNYFRSYRVRGGSSVEAAHDERATAGELPNSTPASTVGGSASKADRVLDGEKKPVLPTDEEIASNPRSRSAKLRLLIMPQ